MMSGAAFNTNTSLAVGRTLVVELDQEWPPNQIMYVLIDTRAVPDSSGKPFVLKRVLRLPLWSSSLSPGSLLAEVFLSVLPFEVGGKQQALFRSKTGTNFQRRLCIAQRVWIHHRPVSSSCTALERKWWVQVLQRLCWISPRWTEHQEVGALHLAFDTDAFTLSLTSGVALVSPAIFHVIALDSEEPIESL